MAQDNQFRNINAFAFLPGLRKVARKLCRMAPIIALFALLLWPPFVRANTGLVGYWTFDTQDISGSTAFDRSGKGNNGTISSATSTGGIIGQALFFNDSSSKVDMGDPASGVLDPGNGSWTHSAWIFQTGTTDCCDMPLYKGGKAPTVAGYDFEIGTSGWNANISDGSTKLLGNYASPRPAFNQWHLYATVVDRNQNMAYAYIDGVQYDSANISTLGSISTALPLTIGRENTGGHNFKGSIDDIRMYNSALSPLEIQTLYEMGVSHLGIGSRSDNLSNPQPSATSNHTIAFTTNNSLTTTSTNATSTLTVVFPPDFDLSTIFCKDVDISFGNTATSIAGNFANRATSRDCPGTATTWGLFISTSTNALTFYTPTSAAIYVATGTPVQILIGTNASFQDAATQWITNPSSAGAYTISVGGTFGGSGNMLVSINSAVTVQTTVAESLAFTVSSVKAANCTADDGATVSAVDTSPTSVPLGTLFPVNTFFTGCQDLVVSTNAGNGYSITVQEQTLMHTSGGFTFPQTACDGAACTLTTAAAWTNPVNNGFGHTCFNQDGNHDCASTYSSGTKFRPTANVAAGDAAQTVMASSTPASVTARIKYRISAGIQQAAGTYTTVIVYTITPTY